MENIVRNNFIVYKRTPLLAMFISSEFISIFKDLDLTYGCQHCRWQKATNMPYKYSIVTYDSAMSGIPSQTAYDGCQKNPPCHSALCHGLHLATIIVAWSRLPTPKCGMLDYTIGSRLPTGLTEYITHKSSKLISQTDLELRLSSEKVVFFSWGNLRK